MRLVDNNQIPARAKQTFAGVFDHGYPGHGRYYLVPRLPGVLAIIGAKDIAANDVELLAELVR